MENVDLSELILEDLIKKGLSGQDLLDEFKRIKAGLPTAISKLKGEATAEVQTNSSSTGDFLKNILNSDAD